MKKLSLSLVRKIPKHFVVAYNSLKSLLEQPGTIRTNAHSFNSLDQANVKSGGSS